MVRLMVTARGTSVTLADSATVEKVLVPGCAGMLTAIGARQFATVMSETCGALRFQDSPEPLRQLHPTAQY